MSGHHGAAPSVGGDGPRAEPAPGAVRAVGILIPARNERDHITACLSAALVALARLPPDVVTALCLVVDRSDDDTGGIARRAVTAHGPTRAAVDVLANTAPILIGAVRNLGARVLLRRLAPVTTGRTWLLSTDADSTVGPDWATEHLRLADAGFDAVAGGVELDGPGRLGVDPTPADAVDLSPRPALYAANLGVRAAPFCQVGGFPAVVSGEEHALLGRLRRDGYRLATGAAITVRTSARTRGRAAGGLADLLRERAAELPATSTGIAVADGG